MIRFAVHIVLERFGAVIVCAAVDACWRLTVEAVVVDDVDGITDTGAGLLPDLSADELATCEAAARAYWQRGGWPALAPGEQMALFGEAA